MTWTGTTGVQGGPATHVAAMKASHHGAATSLPRDMLANFNPRSVIISCGSDYGHPRWELFFWVEAFLFSQNADSTKWTKPLYPMVWPYWFEMNKTVNPPEYFECQRARLKISPAVFSDETAHGADYIDALQNLYKQIQTTKEGAKLKDPYTLFENSGCLSKERWEQLHWIIEQVAARFATVTYVKETASNAVVATSTGPNGLPTTSGDSLQYLRVACRDTADDGRVFVKKLTHPNEIYYLPAISAPTVQTKKSVDVPGNNKRQIYQNTRSAKRLRTTTVTGNPQTQSLQTDKMDDDSAEYDSDEVDKVPVRLISLFETLLT